MRPTLQFQRDNGHTPWWMWLGGILGALFVLGNVYLVPIRTGFAVIIVLIGLMIGSLLIDQFWLASKRTVTLLQIGGLLIMIVGVMVIRIL